MIMKRLFLFIWCMISISLTGCGQSKISVTPMTKEDSIGAWNAVRKAHQMTDLQIIPATNFLSNPSAKKPYEAGKRYSGVVYSSAKETNTFVGDDVSIHTFMTALHNPRSVFYTEHLDEPPYHGKNGRAYYGTVCSGLITYALGIKVTQRSSDIPTADYFELIENQSAKGLRIADLVCKNGHPRLVTDIKRGPGGKIEAIEISYAANSGCRRFTLSGENAFNKWLKKNGFQIYRYKYLYKNTSYKPANNFVAVDGENLVPFEYNDVICANRGDKSCYVAGDDVILNVFGEGDKVEIYKDSKLFKIINLNQNDANVTLKSYPYGDYSARVIKGKKKSDYTYWKIIDVNVTIDKEKNRIIFSSRNATPVYYEFCSIGGGRPTNKNRVFAAELTEEEKNNGYVTVDAPQKPTKKKAGWPYVKVHFECDYGRVINNPLNWYE